MLFQVAAPVSIADSAFVSNTALAGEGGAIWALDSVPLIRARLDCVGPVISADYNLFAIAPGCVIGGVTAHDGQAIRCLGRWPELAVQPSPVCPNRRR